MLRLENGEEMFIVHDQSNTTQFNNNFVNDGTCSETDINISKFDGHQQYILVKTEPEDGSKIIADQSEMGNY